MRSRRWMTIGILGVLFGCTSPQATVSTTVPDANVFSVVYDPSSPPDRVGWEVDTSGHGDSANVTGAVLVCTAGGYVAESHYARVRRKFPEVDGQVLRGPFTMTVVIDLPNDFYSRVESYVRFMNTDNFPSTVRGTSTVVGANDKSDWRVGFLMYGSDHLPRLESDHDGRSKLTLWIGSAPLPVGRNKIMVRFVPAQDSSGSFTVWLNGRKVADKAGVQTAPSTLQPSEIVVTRIVGGIDGAARQSTKQLEVSLRSLSFRAA